MNGSNPAAKPPPDSSLPKREGYGLLGKSSSLSSRDLGPSKDLLERKRREREDERRNQHERRHRTPEERAAALRAMEVDAQRQDDNRRRLTSSISREDEGPGRASASFLRDVRQTTHGIRGDSNSMSERLQQNRHTNQRLDSDSFL
jgi:hypothetical protein